MICTHFVKQPNLNLKTWPKQLLGSLPLAIKIPGHSYLIMIVRSGGSLLGDGIRKTSYDHYISLCLHYKKAKFKIRKKIVNALLRMQGHKSLCLSKVGVLNASLNNRRYSSNSLPSPFWTSRTGLVSFEHFTLGSHGRDKNLLFQRFIIYMCGAMTLSIMTFSRTTLIIHGTI
jgi:hypothetical protein